MILSEKRPTIFFTNCVKFCDSVIVFIEHNTKYLNYPHIFVTTAVCIFCIGDVLSKIEFFPWKLCS